MKTEIDTQAAMRAGAVIAGIALLGVLVYAAGALEVTAEQHGGMMHILDRILDGAVGFGVGLVFMAFALWIAQPVVAPNLDAARQIVEAHRRHWNHEDDAPAITEAEARLAAGILTGAGLRLLALMLIATAFGLFL